MGLYIHVPFCRKKCIYCDFFSAGERIADWHIYVDALIAEFNQRISELACPLRTVYFGGGTPSLMPLEEFERLISHIRPYIDKVEEFTIEVNPEDVDDTKLQVWKTAGVNRLSMGVQTFSDTLLKAIGRTHSAADSLNAYHLARKYFDNISIDLMFGLPGQTLEMWQEELRKVISLRPEHISAYSLMYEDRTALTLLRDRGKIEEVSDDVSESMFRMLIRELAAAGYDHYEISNFAHPGFRSRHNSSYWLQMPYLGLGPSAHSYDGLRLRKANRADLKAYLSYWAPTDTKAKTTSTVIESEILSEEELIEEYIMTRMRTREGIPLDDFKQRFGEKMLTRLISKASNLVDQQHLLINNSHITFSENAILISNSIILDLTDL